MGITDNLPDSVTNLFGFGSVTPKTRRITTRIPTVTLLKRAMVNPMVSHRTVGKMSPEILKSKLMTLATSCKN